MRQKLLKSTPENIVYHSNVGGTFNNLGSLLSNIGFIEEAKEKYKKALQIYETLLNKYPKNITYQSYVGATLNNLGNLLRDLESIEEAKNRYREALEIYETLLKIDPENLAYQSHVGTTLNNLGSLLYLENDYSTTLELCSRARNYALNSANLDLLFKIYWSMGRCYEKLIDNCHAFTNYKESIECIESIRHQCSIEEIKMDILWDKGVIYSDMISFLCIRMNDPEKAWEYLGRFKSRTLLDSLRFLELEAPESIPAELLSQEKKLLESIIFFDRLIRKTSKADELDQLTRRIKESETELNKVYDLI
jgi:tetratricopeptide (TPR) repeat protein